MLKKFYLLDLHNVSAGKDFHSFQVKKWQVYKLVMKTKNTIYVRKCW